ncbi:MAG: alpha-L-arabinofuranosidase [Lachnospiraceae bacterium]|nr:alpha-L-arabinofuranosidase [Lachnospiraceae bacterium]
MSKITVQTSKRRFETAPDLYGIFFEDISRAGDGGLYPEMLRNRSFEDSLLPEGCVSPDGGKTFVSPTGWVEEFNNGEGMNSWVAENAIVETPVPAWYPENCTLRLDFSDTLNAVRKAALRADFLPGGSLKNIGCVGVAQEDGLEYHFYCFAKAEAPVPLVLSVKEGEKVYSEAALTVSGKDWTRYDAVLKAKGTTGNGSFVITAPEGGSVLVGFSSLMPADTFMGHGLRKDLAEKLQAMHPAFMRFPGGCIVEGFTMETAMFFRKTIGPVWERPSFWLLWHYRTSNGLGFHEYLQFCEDLGMQPLYVCNCGMTCQGRKPYYFNDEELEDVLQDTLNALEYALGDETTTWGAYRAKMGHPAPFALKYLEIGNENYGPEYNRRFLKIKARVLEKYPELIILANTKDEELSPDIVDDHYYNMPEFYAENIGIYDHYDRSKPDIFVGEFSVNQTYEGQLRGAVAEAVFMIGFERNQDKVKLCSYAPLFMHKNYHSWYPNLIMYDNHRSYAIPSYYAFRIFGKNRGKYVLESEEETGIVYRAMHGLPFVSGADGTEFHNLKINGEDARPEKDVHGTAEAFGGSWVLKQGPETAEKGNRFEHMLDLVSAASRKPEDIDLKEGFFEAEVRALPDVPTGIGVLCAPKPLSYYDRTLPVPTDPWRMFNLDPIRLVIRGGKASVERAFVRPEILASDIPVSVPEDGFCRLACRFDREKAVFYLEGEEIAAVSLPHYPPMCSVATASEEEIIIKIVNFAEEADDVRIVLDADVEADYTAERFYGEADAENSLETPLTVADESVRFSGACRDFVYRAPAMSVNVLILRKK